MKLMRQLLASGLLLFAATVGMTAEPVALLNDDFLSTSLKPLDEKNWKDVFGAYYQNGTLATHVPSGSHGGAEGGFKSVATFGGRNNGTITLDFLGVKANSRCASNDNLWGMWDSGQPWNPKGLIFRTKPSSQSVQLIVGGGPDVHGTSVALTPGVPYDFRIVWTPGVEAKFYVRKPGVEWETLYSAAHNVPEASAPIQVRDETLGLDIDRITLRSTPIVEPQSARITVDLASRSPRTSLIGFLHGFVGVTEEQIAALRPVYWRSFFHGNYELLKRLGIETSVEFGYVANGASTPIDAGNKDKYISYVKDKYAAVTAAARAIDFKVKYFEFWNEGEGDYVWNPLVRGAAVDKFEREYYAFKIFHNAIRSLKPDAKIVAPSSAHFWPDLMEDFLRRCSRDNLKLDAVSWHVADFQPHELPGQVEIIRRLMRQYPNLGAREIHINEWGWPNIGTGSQMNFFYYMEKSGVDIAAKTIWAVEPLDNLLVKSEDRWQPRVSYWAWKFYGQMGTTRCLSRTDYPFVTALATNDKKNPSVIRLIVARGIAIKQYNSDPVPPPKVPSAGPPMDISVTLSPVPFQHADIRITSLPSGDTAMPKNPAEEGKYTAASVRDAISGQLELNFSQVADEEVFLITIQPHAP